MSEPIMPTTLGGIPQSTALAEASPESLSDLFSRDPEGFSKQDISRIVETLRTQRKAWALAEASGKKSAPRAERPDSPRAKSMAKLLATKTAADLDL
jgi:hypothetical protein